MERYVVLLALLCSGCAARPPRSDRIPQNDDWHACVEFVPAKPDGFHHYVCTDRMNRQYEVLMRRKG